MLHSQEGMISLHNTQPDSAAVALITKSIQHGAPGSLSPDKAHVVPDVCRGEGMNAPVSKTKYPRFPWCPSSPSSSPCVSLYASFFLPTLKLHHGLSRPAQDKFCLHRDGGGGRRAWTKDAFVAVSSGWLRTDNGHILQLLKQIAVCSLPLRRWTEGSRSRRARFLWSGFSW